tara:strand:+ start:623 stop:760 length:138 start_codon:yes stop_codon:yes gene_type:complete
MVNNRRQVKKQTTNERLEVLEKMVVRLSMQMQAILKAIHKEDEPK